MKEICFINKGDNIEKLNYKLGIDKSVAPSNDTIQNYKYLTIKDGDDSIQIVRNYNPYYIVQKNDNIHISTTEFEIISSDTRYIVFKKCSGVKYTVKPLERIEDIAIKFGVTVDYIITTNQLKTNKLFVGQILII